LFFHFFSISANTVGDEELENALRMQAMEDRRGGGGPPRGGHGGPPMRGGPMPGPGQGGPPGRGMPPNM